MIKFRKLEIPSVHPMLEDFARKVRSLQDNVEQAFRQVSDEPFIRGSLLEGISVSSGNNTIKTGLGRRIKGWLVVDSSASIDVYRVDNQPLESSGVLTLNASASATISLWVF